MHRIRSIALIVVAILLTLPGAGSSARAQTPDVSITAGPLLTGYVERFRPYCSSYTAAVSFNVELATGAGTLVVSSPCGVAEKVFPQGSCYFDQSDSSILCDVGYDDEDPRNDEYALIISRLPVRRFEMQLAPRDELWYVFAGTVTGLS